MNTNIPNLFIEEGTDEIYQYIKNEEAPYCAPAKQYSQALYDKHHEYLDNDFSTELRNDYQRRLWELTQISFIADNLKDKDKLVKHQRKNGKCPDFCMEINGIRYYWEATAPGPGKAIELNEKWKDIQGKARTSPVTQYKERICSALKEKAHDKYFGSTGYQAHMKADSGLVIAISLAGIPFYHSPGDHIRTAVSCVLGLSDPKIDIRYGKDGLKTISETYYVYQSSFKKTNSESPIKMDYFCDDQYRHISAVLISYSGWVFFPDAEKYGADVAWQNECRNDYILIHNSFAKIALPHNYFAVAKEIIPVIHREESIE